MAALQLVWLRNDDCVFALRTEMRLEQESTKGLRMRDVGELGELQVRQWGAEIGFSVNISHRDRTGWDFIVELARTVDTKSPHLPLDRQPSPVMCLVQVKSTDKRRARINARLSNWLRLVQSPLPTFHLVLEFDQQNDSQRAFLVPVDEASARIVLTKLRTHSIETSTRPINKLYLPLRYDESHLLAAATANAFVDAIRNYVGDLQAYTNAKGRMLSEIGYEHSKYVLTAQAKLPKANGDESADQATVNFFLGKLSLDNISNAKMWDERFGLRHTVPVKEISIPTSIRAAGEGDIVLTLQDQNSSRSAIVNARLFGVPTRFVKNDRDKQRIRLAGEHFEFQIGYLENQSWTMEISVPSPVTKTELSSLSQWASVALIFCSTKGKTSVRIQFQFKSVVIDNVIETETTKQLDLLELATAVTNMVIVCEAMNVQTDKTTSLEEIFRQRRKIELLAMYFENKIGHGFIKIRRENGNNDPTTNICFPLLLDFVIAETVYLLPLAFTGSWVPTGIAGERETEFELKIHDVREFASEKVTSINADLQEFTATLMRRIVDVYAPSHFVEQWWRV